MTASRTARRIVTAAATLALLAGAPGVVGVASAHDHGGSGSGLSADLAANQPLADAVKAARDKYRTDAKAVVDGFRTALEPVRAAIDAATATQRDAVKKAHDDLRAAHDAGTDTTVAKKAYFDAWTAYRAALAAAKAGQQPAIDAAKTKAKAGLDAARTAYEKAITDAFAAFGNGAAIPPGLLKPFHGFGMGHGIGHGMGMGRDHGRGHR